MDLFDKVLGLNAYLHQPVRKLSLGERMRCDLAASLLHRPPLLFLDEPTIGLDIVAKANVREFLQEINGRDGTTVLLTTHDLADIETLCKRVIVIDHGKLLFDGALDAAARPDPARDLDRLRRQARAGPVAARLERPDHPRGRPAALPAGRGPARRRRPPRRSRRSSIASTSRTSRSRSPRSRRSSSGSTRTASRERGRPRPAPGARPSPSRGSASSTCSPSAPATTWAS